MHSKSQKHVNKQKRTQTLQQWNLRTPCEYGELKTKLIVNATLFRYPKYAYKPMHAHIEAKKLLITPLMWMI